MHMHIHMIYQSVSQDAVQVSQWLSHAWKAEHPVAAQSKRLDVSAALVWHWRPGGFLEGFWTSVSVGIPPPPKKMVLILAKDWHSNRIDEVATKCEGHATKARFPFFLSFLSGQLQENTTQSSFLLLKIWLRKFLIGAHRSLGFSWFQMQTS